MPRSLRSAALVLGLAFAPLLPGPVAAQSWTVDSLTTRDGHRIPLYQPVGAPGEGTVVLLFHQGGASGRAEYAPIVPALANRGFRVATIDQRRGGDLFDADNAVAERFDPETTSYCDAAPDLEAALDWAVDRSGDDGVVLWGSSYSAALVIRLAAERPDDVAGVLAFSPASGDPMEGCRPEAVVDRIDVPLLVLRPESEMEHAWIGEQLEIFEAAGADTYVARPGRHGSSMLVEQRVGASTERVWGVVQTFLERIRVGR